jgi:outer membrane protein OmpA-like peptidoglycan-associated protein
VFVRHGYCQDNALAAYENYDFVAGDTILFEDDFRGDRDGEFPSKWDLISGQGVVNAFQGSPALLLTEGNYVKVAPLMKKKNYLGNEFTIEYDTYMPAGGYALMLFFAGNNRALGDLGNNENEIKISLPEGKSFSAALPSGYQHGNYRNMWHHFAIAFRNKQLKVYLDQFRVLAVPNANMQPTSVQFGGIGSRDHPLTFKNVRIAAGGGMNMVGKKLTDAKIVTHGINFDFDKATIKPESMGTLKMVIQIMKENPELKFEVGGHTDSDGDETYNRKLSQQRADAVRNQLISMGVDTSRLTAKGYGKTKPISDNSTPEGKANNRRVEFTRL